MRTIVDLPEEQLGALSRYCQEHGVSRAEAMRRALGAFLKGRGPAAEPDAFGLWADREEDGLAYEDRIRQEW